MNYPVELDYLIEKTKKHTIIVKQLLIIKDYCIKINNENDFLRHQIEILENKDASSDDESFDGDEGYTYEQIQEIRADNEAKKEENEELNNKNNELELELEELEDRINELEYELKVRDERLNELEGIDDKFNKIEKLSVNSFPVSNNVHIDSAKRISDESAQNNDGYNKILIFSAFMIQQRRNGLWVRIDDQPGFLITNDSGTNYRALFDDPNKRYIIATDSITHQLIVNDKTFQEFISDTGRKRMFTFIEYNESYNSKHAKNFNYNCDQVAAVLLPYIWKQLPTEDRIKLNNFIKIITMFKFDNKGIKADEFRFVIVYKNSNGEIDYYEVNKNIKFVTNISFNFIEQNLYCATIKTFIKNNVMESKEQDIQQRFRNNLNQAWNNNVNKNELSINSSNRRDATKMFYRFDFNFNQVITSENLSQLFLALKEYTRLEIRDKTTLDKLIKGKSMSFNDKEYYDRIINHYVSDFTKEEFNKINFKLFDGLIEPDTVVVSY